MIFMNKRNNKGFTLAELLIVVAIIAVLTAVAIPVFTTQLEKSREATDQANVRSAYADVMAQYLTNADSGYSMSVAARQTQAGWDGPSGTITTQIDGSESQITYSAKTTGSYYTVAITSSGSVTIN
jgi:prepilin-type N-terminal cleavage/methylation domain-containing protein